MALTQSLLSRMSKLVELSHQIHDALDFEKITTSVSKSIKWLLEYGYGVFCINEHPGKYNPQLWVLKKDKSHPDFFKNNQKSIEKLLSQKSPAVITLENVGAELTTYFKWGLVLPLKNIEGENIGFLFFAIDSEKKYNENDVRIGYLTSLQISAALQNTISYNKLNELNREVQEERKKSDELLDAILPRNISRELKETGTVTPRIEENVSVMFLDFSGFTRISEKLSAISLVEELNYCFSNFDDILEKYNVEKLKTIGDSYMCASGLTGDNPNHAIEIVKTALELQKFMRQRIDEHHQAGKDYWGFRIGINSGQVMAGVIGKKKYNFDIWGRTVNVASRMESAGIAKKITVSTETYELIKNQFKCTKIDSIIDKLGVSYEVYTVDKEL